MSTVHKLTPRRAQSSASREPTSESLHSRVQERAFRLFQERGGQHGRDMQDWLEAERQVRVEAAREQERAAEPQGRERAKVMGRRPSSQV